MSKVSVIIPIYNVESYLRECLESVINQTFKDIEIICVDDCGNDNSISIAEDFAKKDERIKIIHHNKNKGLGVARNTGINNANGDYIFFLDSDDYIITDIIEKLYEQAISTNSDIIISRAEAFADNNSSLLRKKIEEFNKYLSINTSYQYQTTLENFTDIETKLPVTAWGKLYKKDFILKNHLLFIEQNVIHEDEGFWLKACSCFPLILTINEKGVMYRIHDNSIMTSKKKNKSKIHFKLNLQDAFDYFDNYRTEYSESLKNQIKNNECFCSYFDKKFGFLYRLRWLKNNKLISLLGIPIYREKIEKENKIIRILGITYCKLKAKKEL